MEISMLTQNELTDCQEHRARRDGCCVFFYLDHGHLVSASAVDMEIGG